MTTEPDWEGEAFKPFQEAGRSHIRMIEFFDSLDIDWLDSLTPQPVDLHFFSTRASTCSYACALMTPDVK